MCEERSYEDDAILGCSFSEMKEMAAQYNEYVNGSAQGNVPETMVIPS